MRKIIALLAIFVVFLSSAAKEPAFENETLTYKVMFKWGLINKQAGTATLSLNKTHDNYSSRLTAHSEPWADKIYKVRDTLNGVMSLKTMTPVYYEKIANEGQERKHDVVSYDYSDRSVVKAKCTRKVFKKGELKIDDQLLLEAEGETVDMLTSFYYMRKIPYQDWTPGQKVTLNIFSGKQKEILNITYLGRSTVLIDGEKMDSFHISFTFTSAGGNKTSDDMEAWISTSDGRIPLKLEGKLPVGKVRCMYVKPK